MRVDIDLVCAGCRAETSREAHVGELADVALAWFVDHSGCELPPAVTAAPVDE